MIYKELDKIWPAGFDVNPYVPTTYIKFERKRYAKKISFIWHEIIFEKFRKFLLQAKENSV